MPCTSANQLGNSNPGKLDKTLAASEAAVTVGTSVMPAFGQTAFGQNRIWPKKSEFGQVIFVTRIWPNRIWPELVFQSVDRIWPNRIWPFFFLVAVGGSGGGRVG